MTKTKTKTKTTKPTRKPAKPLMSHRLLLRFLEQQEACNGGIDFVKKHKLCLDAKSWNKVRRNDYGNFDAWMIEAVTCLYYYESKLPKPAWSSCHDVDPPIAGEQYGLTWAQAKPHLAAFAKNYKKYLREQRSNQARPLKAAAAKR